MRKAQFTPEATASPRDNSYRYRGLRRPGFLYAATDTSGLVKLGASTDPQRRVKELRVAKLQCRLLFTVKVERMLFHEKLIHFLFRKFHVGNEWFEISPDLVEAFMSRWHDDRIMWRLVAKMPDDFNLVAYHRRALRESARTQSEVASVK